MTDKDSIEKLRRLIAFLERETGCVPNFDRLAAELEMDVEDLKKLIRSYLSKSQLEGTSVFQQDLLEILLGGFEGKRSVPFSQSLNARIRDREVRLIGQDGEQLGIVSTREALQLAREQGLDLFLLQPDATPPVARIMDYGRFKFEAEKRARESKRKHHIVDVKEIKMRYKIQDHDYAVKVRSAQRFLMEGEKIKISTVLRGREIQHKDLGINLMSKFANDLTNCGKIERAPTLEGKTIVMILTPLSK